METNFDDEYKKDFLQNQMKSVKEKMVMMGYPNIGDLFSNSNSDVE